MSSYLDLTSADARQKMLQYVGDTQFTDKLRNAQVSYKDVTVTAAQMDTLNATPVSLVAAPGAGKILVLDRVVAFLDAGATPFELGSGTVDVRYQNSSGGLAAQLTNAFVESATDAYFVAYGRDVLALVNQALVLYASADVTAGDGVLYLRLYYRVVEGAKLA